MRSGWEMVHSADLWLTVSRRTWCGVCGEPVERVEQWERSRLLMYSSEVVERTMVAFPCEHTTDDIDGDGALLYIKHLVPGPRELVP